MESHPGNNNQCCVERLLAAFRGMQFKKSFDHQANAELRSIEHKQGAGRGCVWGPVAGIRMVYTAEDRGEIWWQP